MAALKTGAAAGGGGGGGTPAGLTFSPVPGEYSASGTSSCGFTINASQPVIWNWSASGALPTSTVPNGGESSSITISLSTTTNSKICTVTVTSGGDTWTIDMSVTGTGPSSL